MEAGSATVIDMAPSGRAPDGVSALKSLGGAGEKGLSIGSRSSSGGGTGARPEQLEQIVRQTDNRPLGPHVSHPAQPEASKPSRLFDLPKHRFWQRLAPGVDRAPGGRLELGSHLLAHGVSAAPQRPHAPVRLAI